MQVVLQIMEVRQAATSAEIIVHSANNHSSTSMKPLPDRTAFGCMRVEYGSKGSTDAAVDWCLCQPMISCDLSSSSNGAGLSLDSHCVQHSALDC